MPRKLVIVDAAALGYDLLVRHGRQRLAGLPFAPADSVFPALTCTVQASFRTASPPADHGMVANGLFFRRLRRAMFWEQSSALVAGERIWSAYRRRGRTVALLFWQQSLGEEADILLSPAPVHKHHGGMIEDCYSRPPRLYRQLCDALDWPFKLRDYWGPLASAKAGDWIAAATASLLAEPRGGPDLCLTYLPTLDYDLQRAGPADPKAAKALAALDGQLSAILRAAREGGYDVLVFGDYAMGEVTAPPVQPNLVLRQAGLLQTRTVRRMLYPDLHASRAFALVDHEVAHVYAASPSDAAEARRVLQGAGGIAQVLDEPAQAAAGLAHPNSGELVLLAEEGTWLAYPWWETAAEAPDYARHVDIHNKPGYDPCELFFGRRPMSVSLDATRIRGTHGRGGPGRQVAWASTMELPGRPASLLELAAAAGRLLEEEA